MFQQYFQDSEWLHLPLIALVFFFLFFVGVVARVVFGMRNRRDVEQLAALPFTDERANTTHEDDSHG